MMACFINNGIIAENILGGAEANIQQGKSKMP